VSYLQIVNHSMAEEGIGSMTDGARDELRELLFDGVAPPLDTEAMFERTFSASGDDGAHLLPPDDLFDDGDAADELPLDDGGLVDDGALLDDGALVDDGVGPATGDADVALDDLADPGADWSDPADATSADPGVDAGPADIAFDHPISGW
jgi:hypothetical protein